MTKYKAALLIILLFSSGIGYPQQWNSSFVRYENNKLIYTPDEKGNTIPDFSKVGYHKGDRDIPKVKVIKTVSPAANGDAQAMIQKTIDEVAAMPLDKNGFRGAILLKKGIYRIPGSIKIKASGIVLRGEGNGENGTILTATGKGQRDLLVIEGQGHRTELPGTKKKISDLYVPVGATSFAMENVQGFHVGDKIVVYRPGTANWITDLKMDQIVGRAGTRQWKPKEYDLYFEREITRIEGNKISIDIPLVMAMEDKYGGGYIVKYSFEGRISEIGIENILFKSEYTTDTDEDHAWTAVSFNNAENCWATTITARYFGYSCVSIGKGSKFITVTGSKCLDGKSQITGGRRYSFNVNGQMCLVENCETTEGRHDYVTGSQVCGPNVFYNCKSRATHSDIGPHHRWAVGTLYDNIDTDGPINVQDRGNYGSGHGWAGANQVLWNCSARETCVQNPWVSAKNYCIGQHGKKSQGRFPDRLNGEWEGQNKPGLQPASLYMAQLKARK